MTHPESQLCALGRQLCACAERALLDTPLDALGERIGDDDAREILQAIFEAGEADTLRELLTGERLQTWAEHTATPREEQALCAQLRRWLGSGQLGGDDPSRLARVAALPTELEDVLAWARPYDLLGELTRPAHEVIEAMALPEDTSLLECCLGRFGPALRSAAPLAAQRAQDDARGYLMQQAAAHAALAARAALWKKAPDSAALRSLAERLRALVAGRDLHALRAVSFLPARPVSVDVHTGVARAQLRAEGDASSIGVHVFLSGYEQRGLVGECALCTRPGCLHVSALAARLLDACLDDSDRLHAGLVDLVGVPSWKRFMRAVKAEAPASEAKRDERLSFRLRIADERVSVGVVLQHAGPDGRWSAGKLVSARKMARAAVCTARDRPVIDQLALGNRTLSASFVRADLTLLRSLLEHPSVHLEDSDAPLQLREENLHVTLLEEPEGLLPRVTLAGAVVRPLARARGERGDKSYLLHYDRASTTLVFSPLTLPARRLLGALAHFRGVLPPESYGTLAPWLASLEQVARVTAPKALRGAERPTPKRLLLRIAPGFEEGIDVTLALRALPLGPLWPPGQGADLCHGLEDGVPVFARRDRSWEQTAAKQVIEALQLEQHMRLEPFVYRMDNDQAALAVLASAARLGDVLDLEWAERAQRLSVTSTLHTGDLKIEVSKKGQWFRLHGGARNAVADIAIGRLLEAVRRGERFVPVQGRDYVEIERELFERLARAQLCVNEHVDEPAVSIAAAPFWLTQLGAHTTAKDDVTQTWLARARDAGAGAGAAAVIDDAWRSRLREYQVEGVQWLLERSAWAPGVCLADEMGLGKTVQAIALLHARAALGPALVIAPTSVVGNWLEELARFAPTLTVIAHHGGNREKDLSTLPAQSVLVTSYDLVLRDAKSFSGVTFATQIIDEAQMVKNARTQRAHAVASIDAGFRLALSGTPVENRLGDLWSLFHLVAPGLLGGWSRFRSRFAVPIERYENTERAAALRALIGPFLLRRTKDQVARELPSRTEVVHSVELSAAEQDLYEAAVTHARRAIGKRRHDEAARSVQILAELTRLRQLACHPRLVIEDERLESSKLHALMRLLEDILPRGHRVLVFSQFTRHLALLREALGKAAISHLYLDGSTPATERTRLVERFQAGEGQVFMISLKAGGTGLNLSAADYVVHMDPWWNPAAEAQASDRAHRLGQTRPLTIVKLVAQGTIEEKVLALHGHKRRLAGAVIADDLPPAPLDVDALEALLALG